MMEKPFEKITARALSLVRTGERPNDAWLKALAEVYPAEKLKSQEKHSCPKWAFSVLCQSGYIKGEAPGCCPESESKNSGRLTLDALSKLLANPSLSANKAELKRRVFGEKGEPGYRTPNGEVEVLLCLQAKMGA